MAAFSEGIVAIREAQLSDSDAIALLLGELGYPTEVDEARGRLGCLLGRDDGGILVSERGGDAIAMASYEMLELPYRARPQCRITALVVQAGERRAGIARALVGAIEGIARDRGCFRLEVTTQPTRSDALGLYSALGFEPRPVRLAKKLTAD